MNLASPDVAFLHGAVGEKTWFGLLYTQGQLVKKVDKALKAEHNLLISWFEVMMRLAAENDFLSVSSIFAAVSLSSSRVSRVVEDLEQRGLVRRRQGERDARVSEVALTETGLTLYRAADATHRRVVNEVLLAKLSAEEAEIVARIWQRLLGETVGDGPGWY